MFDKVRGWLGPRADADPSTAGYAPSQYSYAQIEAALKEGGIYGLEGAFGIGVGGAVVPYRFPALTRCISLYSALVAQLITRGGLRVVDLRTHKAAPMTAGSPGGRVLDLMYGSPDGRTAAYQWMEAYTADLLTMGNALARVEWSAKGLPRSLHRQSMVNVATQPTGVGDWTYQSRDWTNPTGQLETVARPDMVHAYVGSMLSQNSGSHTDAYLAVPLLTVLRSALRVGADGEKFVSEFFKGGANTAPFAITHDQPLKKEQIEEAYQSLGTRPPGRGPLVFGGGVSVVPLGGKEPQSTSTEQLRQFQIAEIARIYGVPAPLIGQDVTSWGSGISELGRMAYRFGVLQFLDRVLAAFSHRLLKPGYALEIDPISVVRSDPAALQGFLSSALGGPNNPGWMSVNEVRRWSGLPAEVDGDIPVFNPKGESNDDSR